MSNESYAKIIDKIMAMDLLVRSFNDEEYIEPWLMNGVPDGCECRDDYEATYPNDADLELTYGALSAFFCRLIAKQAASITMPEKCTDFPRDSGLMVVRLSSNNCYWRREPWKITKRRTRSVRTL